MPVVSAFFGILIKMFHDDHNPRWVEIASGDVLAGRLPKRVGQLVAEWRRGHVRELRRAWNDAQSGRPPRRIRPLE